MIIIRYCISAALNILLVSAYKIVFFICAICVICGRYLLFLAALILPLQNRDSLRAGTGISPA